MPFREKGYLGSETKRWAAQYQQRHKEYFRHFHALNGISHNFITKAELDSRNGLQLFIAGLFIRSLTVFQAMLILAERGIVSEVYTMIRSLFELRFQVEAIAKCPVTAKRLILNAQRKLSARLEALANEKWLSEKKPQRVEPDVRSKVTQEELKRMEHEILAERPDLVNKNGKLPSLTIKELARLADMETEYEIIYSYLCEATHSSAQYLEEMVSLDAQGNFEGFRYQQSKEKLLVFCFDAAGLHLGNLSRTIEILKTDLPSGFNQLHQRHRELKERLTRQREHE